MVADKNDIIDFIAEKKESITRRTRKIFYDNNDRERFDLELSAIADKTKKALI